MMYKEELKTLMKAVISTAVEDSQQKKNKHLQEEAQNFVTGSGKYKNNGMKEALVSLGYSPRYIRNILRKSRSNEEKQK